jgi:hypothetical protein
LILIALKREGMKAVKEIRKGRFFLFLAAVAFVVAGLLLPRFAPLKSDMAGGIRNERTPPETAEATESARGASFREGVVTAGGIGKISSKSAVSRASARRAALSDARRNLLAEAKRVMEGITGNQKISGHVGYHWIVSEGRDGYLYRVTLAARLADIRVD